MKIAKIITIIIFIANVTSYCYAQELEYLPPVLNSQKNISKGTSLILGTIDYARFNRKPELKPYLNSIQIVDADEPWPPLWYAATSLYTDAMYEEDSILQRLRFYHIGYTWLGHGFMSYLYLAPVTHTKNGITSMKFEGSFVVLNESMTIVDTVNDRFAYVNKGISENHRLVAEEVDTVWDFSKITGNPEHNAVKSIFSIIKVLGVNNKLEFLWNPLIEMQPQVLGVKEKLIESPKSVRLGKINNVFWDYDGNILYSSEMGIGKISLSNGKIMWQIDRSTIPFRNRMDSLICYHPTYFILRKENKQSCIYSYFERGLEGLSGYRGVIFEQDKKSFRIKSIKYIEPLKNYPPVEHGGFEYNVDNGMYALDYGLFDDGDTAQTIGRFWEALDYGGMHGERSTLQLPRWNYAFGANLLKDWPLPDRPTIKQMNDNLIVEYGAKQYTWYELSGTNNTMIYKVGNGSSIKFSQGHTYCVAVPYGIGYVVSKPFETK